MYQRSPPLKQEACLIVSTAAAADCQGVIQRAFQRARERAAQIVTRQHKVAVVIVAIEEFERLTHRAAQPESLTKFFADLLMAVSGIDPERKPDHGRSVNFERLPNRYERHLGTHQGDAGAQSDCLGRCY